MLFDSHVNIHAESYDSDRDAVIERARNVGVSRFISICDHIENFEKIRAISRQNHSMWCTVGVHPHYAKDFSELRSTDLVERCEDPIVCGVGETGLDFHYGFSSAEDQARSFRTHIEAARETGLPLIVHTREADEMTADILESEMSRGEFKLLMHCYTSGARLAERAADLGAYFSVSGILSFKNATEVRDVADRMPLERVILETDCPYLAPVPHRGRRNEPAYLVEVCQAFANLKGLSMEETARITTENCLRLFDRTS